MRRGLLSCAILGLVLLCGDGAAELINKRGKIEGENFVNLRSGPDLSYPSRAVLKKGEEITVEKEEGGWYLVSLMDGRKGYVHRTLVVFRENGEVKPTVKNEDLKKLSVKKEQAIPDPGREGEGDPQSLTAPKTKREPSKGKPLPLVKVL
ncbi:MAG: SH3 domain-containing protein, partial [Candidatus Binatota bacterium]